MGILFLSTECYANSTTGIVPSDILSDLAYGYVRGGETKHLSLRIANDSAASIAYTLSTDDPLLTILPSETGSLSAGALSGTLTLQLTLPENVEDLTAFSMLSCSDGTNVYHLSVSYSTVGPAEHWTDQTAEQRAGAGAEWASNVVDYFSQSYRLYRFDPIGWTTPEPSGAIRYGRTDTTGRLVANIEGRDMCQRLNPLDDHYGYSQTATMIRASFQGETTDQSTSFSDLDTTSQYSSHATLYLPANLDMSRRWARFEDASADGNTPSQWKRTCYLIRRLGKCYSIENLRAAEYQQDLAVYEGDLVEVTLPTPGTPAYWNPFAVVYDREGSNKPYTAYACRQGLAELLQNLSNEPY